MRHHAGLKTVSHRRPNAYSRSTSLGLGLNEDFVTSIPKILQQPLESTAPPALMPLWSLDISSWTAVMYIASASSYGKWRSSGI
jgi:hypothetical protein